MNVQVKIQLSHPAGGNEGPRAELRVTDAISHLTVITVDIPPLDFYKLLSGLVDSSTVNARVLDPDAYQRVGKRRHNWTRRIGYGTGETLAREWAEKIRDTLLLETIRVDNRQGGLWVTWLTWSNALGKWDVDAIQAAIDNAPLPDGAL